MLCRAAECKIGDRRSLSLLQCCAHDLSQSSGHSEQWRCQKVSLLTYDSRSQALTVPQYQCVAATLTPSVHLLHDLSCFAQVMQRRQSHRATQDRSSYSVLLIKSVSNAECVAGGAASCQVGQRLEGQQRWIDVDSHLLDLLSMLDEARTALPCIDAIRTNC